MKSYEFYRKYANTPLADRFKPLNITWAGLFTLSDIYKRVEELGDKMRPDVIELENLLDFAGEYYE